MNFRRMVQVVDTHTAGEPTRVVTAGFPPPQGGTMEERRRWLADNADESSPLLIRGRTSASSSSTTGDTSPCAATARSAR